MRFDERNELRFRQHAIPVGVGALEDLLTLGLGLLFMTVSDGSRDAMLKVCE